MAERKPKSIELSESVLSIALNLERLYVLTPNLNDWLDVEGTLNAMDTLLLDEVSEKLLKNADSWNEEELKMQYISMVIFLARFSDKMRTYYDREIDADIEGVYIKCKADMMLSKGVGEVIQTPYFFSHEYKRERSSSFGGTERGFCDPIGQMLAGMLIAQEKNKNEKPIYGCYVQGRFWFFSILEGKKYAISQPLNAEKREEAERIIFMLRKLNQTILTHLMV
jgi:hypothetical protein